MQLRFLLITGPSCEPATVDFGPGLNVIYGGSNTGKSHVLRLIDYTLGARDPPEPITEQAGYDLVHVGLVLDDGSEKTIVRALQGGNVKVIDGLVQHRPGPVEGVAVSAQHSAKSSLSKMLLKELSAEGARVRTDASGKTRDLSFRDLERHVLINEAKIQEPSSPILSGQYISKTAETSVFKYLLTGVDDSALDLAKPDSGQPLRQAAQLELLDRQIRDLEREITEADQDHEELVRLGNALDEQLSQSFRVQESAESGYRELTETRRTLRREHEDIQDRLAEIDTLEARFELLAEHYKSDEQRLASIIEAGAFFVLEDQANCPVCGAAPGHHRPDQACDGDVDAIAAAATAEVAELKGRAVELQQTIQGLAVERKALAERAQEILPELESLHASILREVPSVQTVRSETNRLVQRKISVEKGLELVRRRDALLAQRADLGVSPGYDSTTIVAQQQLDGATLDAFCQVVESELQSWKFPDARRVFFELQKLDISVGGKSRAANGKGVRALLHGAFSIGLMRYCRERKRAHPGFLLLDSLFITYRDPSDEEEAAIAGTPLKDRAFLSFASLPNNLQLIVLDNVDVPDWLDKQAQCTHFTGRPGVGRAGLFPPVGFG
jgi:AAA domain